MLRLGQCCIFRQEPVNFRRTTARYLGTLSPSAGRRHLAALCRHNAESLQQALAFCRANGIGAFRINSQILPLKTHPVFGYDLFDLPGGGEIRAMFRDAGRYGRDHGIRTTFHPDQFHPAFRVPIGRCWCAAWRTWFTRPRWPSGPGPT